MRLKRFSEENLFLFFVAFVSGILFLISGTSPLSAILTGLFIYAYLRILYFIFSIIVKLFARKDY